MSKSNRHRLISPRVGDTAQGESLRIAILALPNSVLSDIAGTYEAFIKAQQLALKNPLLPSYEIDLLTSGGRKITTLSGLTVAGARPFSQYKGFPDTLIVTGEPDSLAPNRVEAQLKEWIRAGDSRIRRICSVCTAVFCLASAGILDGHHATTHWRYAHQLARSFPRIKVNPEPDGCYIILRQ